MLKEILKNYKIILASGSPRRQQFFKDLDLDFEIKLKEIEEIYPDHLEAQEITNYLALLKANAFEGEINENEKNNHVRWLYKWIQGGFPNLQFYVPDSSLSYLTIDDSPSPNTLWILDLLDMYQMKARFFCIGKNIEQYPKGDKITDGLVQLGRMSRGGVISTDGLIPKILKFKSPRHISYVANHFMID